MPTRAGKVYVIDDDAAVRDALGMLFQAENLDVEQFASAQDFLEAGIPDQPGCLITDLRMPGMSGLGLQRQLQSRGIHLAIIFISGHGNIDSAVQAMKQGAIDFIEKPFRNEVLLERTRTCLDNAARLHEEQRAEETARAKLASLTPREHEVLECLVQGNSSKHIARQLEISPKTVDIHRGHILEKFGASSVTNLLYILTPILPDLKGS